MLEIVQIVIASHEDFRVYSRGWGDLNVLVTIGLNWFNVPVLTTVSKFS